MKTKLVDGQTFGTQHRTVSIVMKREGEQGAEIDEADRIVKNVSVSSDEPYERFFGTEILSHDAKAIDLSRVTKGAAPLLFNHDTDALIGKVMNPRLEKGRLIVDLKFSKSARAQEVLTDVKDGILTECSIGYSVDKFEVDEKTDTYTATKWTLYECSMAPVPADFSVGVGRSDQPGTTLEVKNKIDETETKPQTVAPAATTQPIKAMPAEIEAPKIDTEAVKKEAQAELRALWKKMDDHVAAIKIPAWREAVALVANKHKEDGSDFDTFKAAAVRTIENLIDERATKLSSDGEGSGIEVVGERGRDPRRALSIGAQFIRSKDFKERGPQTGRKRSITMDADMSVLGIRGKVALAQRAGFNSSDLTAINVAPIQGLVGLGVQRLTVMDLVAGGVTGAAAIPYPLETTLGTVDGVAQTGGKPMGGTTGERGLKPLWEPDITTETANVKKITITTKVPDEFLSDFPGFQSFIDERLPFMVDTRAEQQILYGDGVGNNIKGITTFAGVQTRVYATNWFTTLKKAITDVEVGSFFTTDGIVMHPYDWETASLEVDLNGQPLAGGPFYIPYGNGVFIELRTYWGKPVVVTTACTVTQPIVGCFKLGAQFFIREGMRIETTNANEDDFRRNLIAVRAEERAALAVYRPVSFLEVTGGPART